MPTTWFTSDTHFGHASILTFCARPFADIVAHDEALIANWNARVAPR
jgi:calcineurin-like phosphoesterase family protein